MDPEERLIERAELRPAHLKQHPAWVNCQRLCSGEHLHTFAEATTFHPYTGPLPVNPVNAHNEFYFVRAVYARRRDADAQLGKRPRDVFPLAVTAEEGLTLGSYRGALDGFYRVRSTPPYDAECFT